MKRLVAKRDNRLDDMMNRFVPNPALLKQRLERTGKEWQLGRYVAVSLGIAMLTALAATAGGVPLILAIMLGLLVGIALPHKAVSILIQKRISRFRSEEHTSELQSLMR